MVHKIFPAYSQFGGDCHTNPFPMSISFCNMFTGTKGRKHWKLELAPDWGQKQEQTSGMGFLPSDQSHA